MPLQVCSLCTHELLWLTKTSASWQSLWGTHSRWADNHIGLRAQSHLGHSLQRIRPMPPTYAGWNEEGRPAHKEETPGRNRHTRIPCPIGGKWGLGAGKCRWRLHHDHILLSPLGGGVHCEWHTEQIKADGVVQND